MSIEINPKLSVETQIAISVEYFRWAMENLDEHGNEITTLEEESREAFLRAIEKND